MLTDEAEGTAGMTLVERPRRPQQEEAQSE